MSSEKRYFNFPIQLLDGFMIKKDDCLNDILHFALYDHAKNNLKHGTIAHRFSETANYYSVTLGSLEFTLQEGKRLYSEFGEEKVKVGICKEIYWDFRTNDKTPFEDVCLLAYLALRSILRNKPFCKITNLYWLSRMNGNTHALDEVCEISEPLKKYANEYQLNKIKFYLMDAWNLVHYGRYIRGFYISFKLDLGDLVYQVEKKRKSLKMRQQKDAQKLALTMALEKLNNE